MPVVSAGVNAMPFTTCFSWMFLPQDVTYYCFDPSLFHIYTSSKHPHFVRHAVLRLLICLRSRFWLVILSGYGYTVDIW